MKYHLIFYLYGNTKWRCMSLLLIETRFISIKIKARKRLMLSFYDDNETKCCCKMSLSMKWRQLRFVNAKLQVSSYRCRNLTPAERQLNSLSGVHCQWSHSSWNSFTPTLESFVWKPLFLLKCASQFMPPPLLLARCPLLLPLTSLLTCHEAPMMPHYSP